MQDAASYQKLLDLAEDDGCILPGITAGNALCLSLNRPGQGGSLEAKERGLPSLALDSVLGGSAFKLDPGTASRLMELFLQEFLRRKLR